MASPLTIDQLFTPSPPGINSQNPAGTIAPNSWLATLLADGTTLGLPTTAWQAGQPIRTVMAIQAVELAKEDSFISQQAQGGFLDFAATGTVTFTDLDGTTTTVPVSPDPSIPGQNPNANLTWLDLIANSVYNIYRTQATAASGPLYFANLGTSTSGTYAAGVFHTANTQTNATFSNQTAFTGTQSSILGTNITVATAASPVSITTQSAHGLTTGNVVYIANAVVTPNGFYAVTVASGTVFTLNGSSGSGSYTGTSGLVYSTQAITTAADVVGTSSNSPPGLITKLITSAPNCYVANLTSFAGANWQSNVSLASQCRAKLAALSPNGPQGAYLFYALASYLILSGESPVANVNNATAVAAANYLSATGLMLPSPLPTNVVLDGGAITRALPLASTATGVVTTTLANGNGPVDGCINNAITNVTATSPIQVTTGSPHNLVTGDYVQVNAVQGVTGANGVAVCTVLSSTTVSLNGTSGTGVYTFGGQLSGGDVYAVNQVIQAFCVPNGVTAITQSANPVTATIAATVYVPAAYVPTYTTALGIGLTAYFASFPIGGLNVDNALNVLPIGAIEGLLYALGSVAAGQFYTRSVTGVLINGVPNDLSLTATGVAVLGSPAGIVIIGQ
jgi:hypothetical protein